MNDCKVKCLKGPRGPQGPQGPQGEDGLCIEFEGTETVQYTDVNNDPATTIIASVTLNNVQAGDIVLLQASSNWFETNSLVTEINFIIRRGLTEICQIIDSVPAGGNNVMTSFHCLDTPPGGAVTYDLLVRSNTAGSTVSSTVGTNGFFTALLIRPN